MDRGATPIGGVVMAAQGIGPPARTPRRLRQVANRRLVRQRQVEHVCWSPRLVFELFEGTRSTSRSWSGSGPPSHQVHGAQSQAFAAVGRSVSRITDPRDRGRHASRFAGRWFGMRRLPERMSDLRHHGRRLPRTLWQARACVYERRRSLRPTAQPGSIAADEPRMPWRGISDVIAVVLLRKLLDP
jgi:hypothetical protein